MGHSPFGVSLLSDGRLVVAEDSARLRFAVSPTNAIYSLTRVLSVSKDGLHYRVATNGPGRTALVSLTRSTGGYRIAVRIEPARGVMAVYDSFSSPVGAHFLGGGENGGRVDLSGVIAPVEVDYHCSYAPVPYFASTQGWGLRIASENVAAFAFPGSSGGAGCQSSAGAACVFPPLSGRVETCEQGAALVEDLYVGSFAALLADYEAQTGRPRVPPPSELELIKWRDGYTTPAQVIQEVTRFQQAGIPIGWVELDDPWEPCVGDLRFSISDPRALIARVHALGVRFMLWVSPKAVCSTGYPAGGLLGPSDDRVLDFRNRRVLAIFQTRLRRLVALGVNGVKGDRGDEVDLGGALTNEYPLLFAHAVLGALPANAAGMFRAATVGSQSVLPGMWAGDQEETWQGLQAAIIEAQTAGMSGFPTWGSDIGGYAPAALTGELFARWAQLGAVSPVMEVGGDGPNETPWLLGAEAMPDLRAAAVLHYELYPYLDGLLRAGQPVLRPLGYGFPADAHSWSSPLELLVGPDLLAAPVTGPGTTPSVYLPPGSWVDLFSGRTVAGGGPTFTRPTPLDEFPLYARAGSVLPFNLRTASDAWWDLNALSAPGRAGFLAVAGARLDLRGLPAHVQLFVPAARRPAAVTLAGRRLVGWSWNAGPLPGVVLRLKGPTLRGRLELSASAR